MAKLFTAVLFLAVVSLCQGLGPAWYTCDPALCKGASGCVCPSWTNPGNYQPVDTPQFVLITHDDAVTALSNSVVRQVTDGFKNANGCNVPATWFTIEFGTDCKLVKQLWDDNHEIAVHTVNHTALVKTLGEQDIEEQISGAKAFLASCGVPEADLKGFRSPYLIHNPLVRQILSKNGYLYDSSITEYLGDAEYTFTDTTVDFGTKRLWPYTMDRGIIQNCEWTAPDGECTSDERYAGMFEVPMWDLPADTTGNTTYTMDPDGGYGGDLFTLLKTDFDLAYNGNRAPFPLFVHAPWFTPARVEATKKFIEHALNNPNTWFVTVDQLLQYMKNPVPANQYGETYKCKPVNLEALQTKPCLLYTVQSGDFISNIAGKFGLVNATELIKINPALGGANPVLQPGQQLKIPPFNESCGAGIPSNGLGVAPAPAAASLPTCRTWTVKTGDYLYKISESTISTVTDLVSLNKLGNANAGLTIGQVLKVPPYPECCDTQSCPLPEAASAPAPASGAAGIPIPPTDDKNRVEIMFDLGGASPTAFGAEYVSGFSAALAQLLGVSPDSVKLTTSSAPGRRRRLMATAAAAPAPAGRTKGGNDLMVQAVIVTSDPLAVYNQTQKIIENGQLAQTLSSQGLTMPVAPVVTVYQGGKKVDVPSTFTTTSTASPAPSTKSPAPATNTTKPAPAPASTSSDDGGMSTGAIVGISIGAAAAGIAAIALAWFCIRDCKGKKQDDETPRAPTATFSLKQQRDEQFMAKP